MDNLHFITDRQIYEQVIQEAVPSATEFLWLATSDLKDLHILAIKAQFDRVWMGRSARPANARPIAPITRNSSPERLRVPSHGTGDLHR